MTRYGQVIIGPPGSGKTTYCTAVQQFLLSPGALKMRRPVVVVNLDPANDSLPYVCDVDISDLVTVQDVMQVHQLGPNGALLYCLEYLESHVDWLRTRLEALPKDVYLLFDFPGQTELYTHNSAVRRVLKQLERWDYRLTTVNLSDSHYCTDPSKFISVVVTALTSMVQLETPHINVLSKTDLLELYGRLPFHLDYFTDVLDLAHLADILDADPFTRQFAKLNRAISSVVNDYSLVSFLLLSVNRSESLSAVINAADNGNGYCYFVSETGDPRGAEPHKTADGTVRQQQDYKEYLEEHYARQPPS